MNMNRQYWTETYGDVAIVHGLSWPIDDAIEYVASGARAERLKAMLQDVPSEDHHLFYALVYKRRVVDADKLLAYGRLVLDFVAAYPIVAEDYDEVTTEELQESTEYDYLYLRRIGWQSPIVAAGLLK